LLVPLLGPPLDPLLGPMLVPLMGATVGELNTLDRVEDAGAGVVLDCHEDIWEVDEERDIDVLVVDVVDAAVSPLDVVVTHVLQVAIVESVNNGQAKDVVSLF